MLTRGSTVVEHAGIGRTGWCDAVAMAHRVLQSNFRGSDTFLLHITVTVTRKH